MDKEPNVLPWAHGATDMTPDGTPGGMPPDPYMLRRGNTDGPVHDPAVKTVRELPRRKEAGADSAEAEENSTPLREALKGFFSSEQIGRLQSAQVGIVGCGGLGSNVALMLARSGIEQFLLADGDAVDVSNLTRQQYWPCHVGMPKVDALSELLTELNPAVHIEPIRRMLTPEELPSLLPVCTLWIEAVDAPETKAAMTTAALIAGRNIISASGMAGMGGPGMQVKRVGSLTLAGDLVSDVAEAHPYAPRVAQAAALMADAVLQILLDGTPGIPPFAGSVKADTIAD